MMNFSAFAGPFSGIHQFAAKFGHDSQSVGGFTVSGINGTAADNHSQRYQTNNNHFNQNPTSVTNAPLQYKQNITIPHSQPQTDLGFLRNDYKPKNHTKFETNPDEALNQQILQNVNHSWQTLANNANTVEYSSHLLSASLPISIQHFLKYSETIKKETNNVIGSPINSGNLNLGNLDNTLSNFSIKGEIQKNDTTTNLGLSLGDTTAIMNNSSINHITSMNSHTNVIGIDTQNNQQIEPSVTTTTTKKTKKKKVPKEKKIRPKPGEIRETKCLDGSVLFCCPECQMAYPDRSLIEQHVISHAVERRFVCDICNAALKRKDHLTRHKLSHIPDRPHICNICLKAFKRKEQLTLHIVIHSGEKKHICQECGKGFYRKDHLRKHTRSHIARRVKSEVSAQQGIGSSGQAATCFGS